MSPSLIAQSDCTLGSVIAMDGDLLVASIRSGDVGADQAGMVKVFSWASGALLHTLFNPTPALEDNFGGALAVSGTKVVVGKSQHDLPPYTDSGIVYVYDLSSATPTIPTLTIPNPILWSSDFGATVALDGSILAVGALNDNAVAGSVGAIYIYDLNSTTPTVPIRSLRPPNGVTGDLLLKGGKVILGNPFANSSAGKVLIYDLNAADPSIPAFTISNPEPTPPPNLTDRFGDAIAIDANILAVGAPQDDAAAGVDSGSVYVYNLGGATPTVPVLTVHNPTPSLEPVPNF